MSKGRFGEFGGQYISETLMNELIRLEECYEFYKKDKEFNEELNKLLNEHNKTQKEVAAAIDVSPQTFNTWCKGIALPRMGKVQMLADYFGILKSDLIENKSNEQNQSYYLNPETSKIAQEIYDNKELSLLFDAARDAEPEDLQTVHSMLMALKRKEKGE